MSQGTRYPGSAGKIYLFSPDNNTLTLKKSGLSVTSQACATDVSQGWSDLWVFFAFTLQGFAKLSKDKKKRRL